MLINIKIWGILNAETSVREVLCLRMNYLRTAFLKMQMNVFAT